MYPRNSSARTQFRPHWTCHEDRATVRHCQVSPRGHLTILRTHSTHHGFWKTIKLTPGEVALKKKYRLLCSKSASPSRNNKNDTFKRSNPNTTWTSQRSDPLPSSRSRTPQYSSISSSKPATPRLKTKPPVNRPATTSSSSLLTQGEAINNDPDKLDLSRIMENLRTNDNTTQAESPRQKPGVNPATALELALRSATRVPPRPEVQKRAYYQNQETPNGVYNDRNNDGCPFCILQAEARRKNMACVQTPDLGLYQSHAVKSNPRSQSAREGAMRRTPDEGPAATSRSLSVFNNSLPVDYRRNIHLQSARNENEQIDRNPRIGPEFTYSQMPLTPAEWVRILKANPGDPILDRYGVESNIRRSKTPVKLPSIHDKVDGETTQEVPVTIRLENRPSHQQHPRPGPGDDARSWKQYTDSMQSSSGNKLNAPNNTPEPEHSISSSTERHVSFDDMLDLEGDHTRLHTETDGNGTSAKLGDHTEPEEVDEGIELNAETITNTAKTSEPTEQEDKDENESVIKVDIVVLPNKSQKFN
jgi:hypothetical protein